MRNRILGMAIAVTMAVGVFIPSVVLNAEPAAAAVKAPAVEEVSYKKGVIEVEFRNDVRFRNVKISVKDSKGKKYSVYRIRKGDDEIEFKLKKPKSGIKYNFVIDGVRSERNGSYTKVKGSVKAPAVKKRADIGLKKAKAIALKHAGIADADEVYYEKARKDLDDGVYLYEIEFTYGDYEYEYEIKASNGRILEYDIESVWD